MYEWICRPVSIYLFCTYICLRLLARFFFKEAQFLFLWMYHFRIKAELAQATKAFQHEKDQYDKNLKNQQKVGLWLFLLALGLQIGTTFISNSVKTLNKLKPSGRPKIKLYLITNQCN